MIKIWSTRSLIFIKLYEKSNELVMVKKSFHRKKNT